MNAYIITTKNAFKSEKVEKLTQRCVDSCHKFNLKPILVNAVVPATLEKVYPGWPVREDYRERLYNNYRRKAGKEPTDEIRNRMIVMQQCMTMSHYRTRQAIIERGDKVAVILEHDAIIMRELDKNLPYDKYAVNLTLREQCTHGYTVNPESARKYNNIYEKTGFAGHDNMNRYIHKGSDELVEEIKVSPYQGVNHHGAGGPVVGGNALHETQWDTHRGALKTHLDYVPTTTTGVYNKEG